MQWLPGMIGSFLRELHPSDCKQSLRTWNRCGMWRLDESGLDVMETLARIERYNETEANWVCGGFRGEHYVTSEI